MPKIPPPPFALDSDNLEESETIYSMLIAWYMSGYHTGYYKVNLYLYLTMGDTI